MLGKSLEKLLLISALLMLLTSCGGGGSSNNSESYNVYSGIAQKGPFTIGSEVEITALDSNGNIKLSPIKSTIHNHSGEFSFQLEDNEESSYYRMRVSGTFLNESNGFVTDNEISLTSITQNINDNAINVLTHWINLRTNALVNSGKAFTHSLDQSKTEIAKILGINNPNYLDMTNSKSAYKEQNAMLLLLSGALMEASDRHDVKAQKIIDEIGEDFADDGILSEKGDDWFLRIQALVKNNPQLSVKKYAKKLRDAISVNIVAADNLPQIIPLASRPVANVPSELLAEPGQVLILDGSASNDSGNIINFTWFRVDQQTEYDIQVSDRFSATPFITVPDEATVLAAPDQEISLLYALVVTDVDKLTHTGVVKVTVKIPPTTNNPPVADNQSLITDEDTPISIILSASDIDGDQINFALNTPFSTTNGIVDLDSALPNVIYTPAPDFFGSDSFTFIVNDGFENSNLATVNIQVNPVNDPPIADAGIDQTVESNTNVELNGSGVDVDGTIDGYFWQQTSAGSVISLSDFSIPNPSFTSPTLTTTPETLTFSLIVTDNDGSDSIADIVDINVNPPNQPPTANAGPDQSVTSNTLVTLNGSGTDLDGTIASYAWTQRTGNLSVTFSDSTIANPTFTAPLVTGTAVTLIYDLIVTDDDGAQSAVDFVEVIVNPAINLPPTAANISLPIDLVASTGTLITLIGDDPDGDNTRLTYEILTNPLFGDTTPSVGQIPSNGNTTEYISFSVPSTDSFDYRVIDELGAVSNTATVSLTIPNTPPTANSFSVDTRQEVSVVINEAPGEIEGIDLDGDTVTIIDITDPSDGTLVPSTVAGVTSYTYNPNPGFYGEDSFTYKVNDGTDDSATATVTIDVNARPIANAGFNRTVTQTDNVTLFGSSSNDPDGTISLYEWSQRSTDIDQVNLTDANTETPTFTAPTINAGGPDKILNFDLFVTDNQNFRSLVDSTVITVTETCVSQVPIASTGVNRNVVSGNAVTLYGFGNTDVSCLSENFPAFNWTQIDVPPDPDVNLNSSFFGSTATFNAPAVNFITELNFQLIVSDDLGLSSDPVVMTVTVHPDASTLPANLPPIPSSNLANYDVEVLGNGDIKSISLVADDPDGDNQGLTYRLVSSTSNGTLEQGFASNGSSYRYIPNYPVAANDSFVFIATDQDGLDSAPITVNISRIAEPAGNNPPLANGSTFTGRSVDSQLTIQVDDFVSELDVDDFYRIILLNKIENNVMFEELTFSSFSGTRLRVNNLDSPNPASGEYEFIAVDKFGRASAVTKFIVNFNGANPPTANAGVDRIVAPNERVSLFGTGTDSDGTILRYSWTQAQGTAVTNSSGSSTSVYTFNTPNITSGSEVLVFELIVEDDERYESTPDQIRITVDTAAIPNNIPSPNSFSFEVNQDSSIVIPQGAGGLGGTDLDGDPLSIDIYRFAGPFNGDIEIDTSGSNDIYTYIPDSGECGTDRFDYTVHDGKAVSNRVRVNIVINCPPVALDLGDFTIDPSGVPIVLSGTDEEGTIVNYEIITAPSNGSFDSGSVLPNLVYLPNNPSSPLADQFSYRVIDEGGLPSTPQVVNLIVGNGVPSATSGDLVIPAGAADAVFDLNDFASDPDGDSFTFEIVGDISSFSFTLSNTFETDGLVTGIYRRFRTPTFQFRVIDNKGAKSNIATMRLIRN